MFSLRSLSPALLLTLSLACGGEDDTNGSTGTSIGTGATAGDTLDSGTGADDGGTGDGGTGEDGGGTGGTGADDAGTGDGGTGDDGGGETGGGGTTGGGAEDPSYPRPEGGVCPDGFVLLLILDGGTVCTMECPNDGATTCQPGATGDADPWCSFPSETASDADCTDTMMCEAEDEECIMFVETSHCRDDKSRCGLWCGEDEKTCPDGMTCAGSFCAY